MSISVISTNRLSDVLQVNRTVSFIQNGPGVWKCHLGLTFHLTVIFWYE